MRKIILFTVLAVNILSILSGCATFRSGIKGEFEGEGGKNIGAEKVDVLFVFSHYKQVKGYDAIPKLENKHQIINDFDDLFIDAMTEFSNINRYTTFTEYASDVSEPKRRIEKDSLVATHDYVMRIKFMKEISFSRQFLGSLFSTVTVTVLPIPYKRNYSVTIDVFNHEDILLKNYTRQASLTKWVQTLLIFVYPFHTERRKAEEIYINLMHDVFQQVETEKILIKN
ncbi:MAG: hypothetical protein P9L92_03725 [Candidatus Electryonea clarkiae]|nr:hypothetical protein [Candidatus Electryonea clarkiae]MDP8288749.1 hypothetical protein [Candidatus Electryonea clarkiae]